MADAHVVHALKARRDEARRAVVELETRAATARADLAHLNATLRLFGVNDPEGEGRVVVRSYSSLAGMLGHNEVATLALEALAGAPDGLTTRELAGYAVKAKGWDDGDRALREAIARRVATRLHRLVIRGKATDGGLRAGVRVWRAPCQSRPQLQP